VSLFPAINGSLKNGLAGLLMTHPSAGSTLASSCALALSGKPSASRQANSLQVKNKNLRAKAFAGFFYWVCLRPLELEASWPAS